MKKVGGWTGTGKPDLSRLLKLSDAARRLGCHVETLRLWVRDGDLKAVRGPHGAYYVAPEDMHGLLAYRRSRPVVLVTPGGTARAWAAIERGLSSAELALLRAARQDPALNLALYRIVAVHHLMALGLSFDQIAAMLGISARHVRRLAATSLRGTLLRALRRHTPEGQSREDVRKLVRRLRARLEDAGFRRHTVVDPRRGGREPTTAFTTKELSPREVTWLRTVGLTDHEIEAIRRVGIGQDELNELLLTASRQHGSPATTP